MRRSLFAGIGVAAVLVLAACTDRAQDRAPLLPTEPSLAASPLCAGGGASNIAKDQKKLFLGDDLTEMQNQFTLVKDGCPVTITDPTDRAALMTYIDLMISNRTPANAQFLAGHLYLVTEYATGAGEFRDASVFGNTGGAAVLVAGGTMTTFDQRARLIAGGTAAYGAHLYTFERKPSSFCGAITTLQVNGAGPCYDAKDYPPEQFYSPAATLTLCLHSNLAPLGIVHGKSGFGGEVLPEVAAPHFTGCDTHTLAVNGWLGREAGPVGKVLAMAYDYLRPRPLFADDVGESGSIGLFSPVGGAQTVVFADDLDQHSPGPFTSANTPDVGDSWFVNAPPPAYAQIQNGIANWPGNVLVISQAQGNCAQCPITRVVGTRTNGSLTESVGSFLVQWSSLQNKPSVKDAPFVVLAANDSVIAKLSYVTESSQNYLRYNGAIVMNASTTPPTPVTWTQNVPQDFEITVNLNTTDNLNEFTTSLAINGITRVTNAPFVSTAATNLTKIGYVLSGIDAGIIGAKNFLVIRLSDPTTPP